MVSFRHTVPFHPLVAERWPPEARPALSYLCPHCGAVSAAAVCSADGRQGWLMGPSSLSPPPAGASLVGGWPCAAHHAVAPGTWAVELAAPPHGALDAAPAAPLQGYITAAPCLAALTPAYLRWFALHELLARQPPAGTVAARALHGGRGGWLTAGDLGPGRRLSELMAPHGQMRGVGQRQAAQAVAAVAEILLALLALGHSHGQVNLATVTLQLSASGLPIYQLTAPPLPPLPPAQLLEFASPWQLTGLAPELLRGGLPSAESDVFALGAMAFVLATGRLPFGEQAQPRAIVAAACSGHTPMVRLGLPEATQEFVEPVTRALAADPARRPSLGQFVQAMVLAERSSRRAFARTRPHPVNGSQPQGRPGSDPDLRVARGPLSRGLSAALSPRPAPAAPKGPPSSQTARAG